MYGGPLHMACCEGLVDLAKELIKAGADVNLLAAERAGTPLSSIFVHYRVVESSSETKSQLIDILLGAGADPVTTGGSFDTVAAAAALGGEGIHLSMLASKGVSFVSSDGMGRQPLHLAAVRGDMEIVSFILDAGGKATKKDKIERSAISWAAQGGSIEVLRNLLQHTGDDAVNEPDIDGWTPLHWVSRGVGNAIKSTGGNQYETIKMLLDRGADRAVNQRINGREYTPESIARYHGCNHDILNLLASDKEWNQQPINNSVLQERNSPPILTNNKRFREDNNWCNFCLFPCNGLRYSCRACMDFDLCYKCYSSKDRIHPSDHEFEEIGPEFVVDEVASHSRSPSPKSSLDEASSSSDSDSDDEDGDE
ncbi:ankyrin repeat-containing domain protein [Annulohypoxylon bovei var. microspora]|nr:ankyrin repeat-containing domain protein [Annulohypoxylon bovei var. microspora]